VASSADPNLRWHGFEFERRVAEAGSSAPVGRLSPDGAHERIGDGVRPWRPDRGSRMVLIPSSAMTAPKDSANDEITQGYDMYAGKNIRIER
jgi:hypothetical protein